MLNEKNIVEWLADKTIKEWVASDVLWPNGNLHKHSVDQILDIMKGEKIDKISGPDGWYLTIEGEFNNPFNRIKEKKSNGKVEQNNKDVVFNGTNSQINPHSYFYVGEDIEVKTVPVVKPRFANEIIAETVMEYIKHVSNIGMNVGTVWYRGQSVEDHLLIPNIYRPNVFNKLSETYRDHCDTHVARLECLQLEQFRGFAFPYLEYMPNNEQEWLILMQHYGLKTRLLDFSLDPLIALSFVLQLDQVISETTKASNDESPGAVWVLNPLLLNKEGYNKYHLPNIASDRDYSELDAELKIGDKRVSGTGRNKKTPLAVVGALNNKRIVSQSGVFLLYPNLEGRSNFDEKCEIDRKYYYKIIIPSEKKAIMRSQLRGMGYNVTKLYPEMKSVAADINYRFETE